MQNGCYYSTATRAAENQIRFFFFKNNSDKFDLIFIDGLHIYDQVKKDILNSLDVLNEKGFILLHDCFPLKYLDQAVPRAQKHWNGDVWRAILESRTYDKVNTFVGAFDKQFFAD